MTALYDPYGARRPAAGRPPGRRPARRRPLTVAAASDLQSVLPGARRAVRARDGPAGSTLTFGSSGNFFSQIQNGAPFDLFFSADVDYPRRLEAAGLTEPGTLQPYAIGRLVLYARNGVRPRSRARPGGPDRRARAPDRDRESRARAVRPRGRRRAHATSGSTTASASKLVLGENISQAAQFVQSGNAEVGLLALSLALSPALRAQRQRTSTCPRPSIRRSNRRPSCSRLRPGKDAARAVPRVSRAGPRACRPCRTPGFVPPRRLRPRADRWTGPRSRSASGSPRSSR